MSTPANFHVFSINYKSPNDGQMYMGQFTCRRQTVADISKIKLRRMQLSGGFHYDSDNPGVGLDFDSHAWNTMCATLDTVLVDKPSWFDLDSLFESDLVNTVYREVSKFENSFRPKPTTGPVSSRLGEAGSSSANTQPNNAGNVGEVVYPQVSATLDP